VYDYEFEVELFGGMKDKVDICRRYRRSGEEDGWMILSPRSGWTWLLLCTKHV